MDLRFEVLLKALHENQAWTRYVIAASAGAKGLSKPDDVDMGKVKIFKRLGEQRQRTGGKYYDEMTPEQVNKRMRAFAIQVKGKNQ